MKKLMIALAVAACAVAANAASFDWKTSATGKIYVAGSSTDTITGTAYLFDSAAYTQQAVLTAFAGTGIDFTKALDDKAVASGKIAATSGEAFTWGSAGDSLSAYVVLVSGDNVFISDTVSQTAPAISYATLQFALKDQSQAAALSTDTFSAGGWYTAAVPEPTSGLLMLLGMAGLALRRRRA